MTYVKCFLKCYISCSDLVLSRTSGPECSDFELSNSFICNLAQRGNMSLQLIALM